MCSPKNLSRDVGEYRKFGFDISEPGARFSNLSGENPCGLSGFWSWERIGVSLSKTFRDFFRMVNTVWQHGFSEIILFRLKPISDWPASHRNREYCLEKGCSPCPSVHHNKATKVCPI